MMSTSPVTCTATILPTSSPDAPGRVITYISDESVPDASVICLSCGTEDYHLTFLRDVVYTNGYLSHTELPDGVNSSYEGVVLSKYNVAEGTDRPIALIGSTAEDVANVHAVSVAGNELQCSDMTLMDALSSQPEAPKIWLFEQPESKVADEIDEQN